MDRGYVKVWRKTLDSEVFADPILLKLWCLCLMKANHKTVYLSIDGIARPIKISPGEFITGRFSLHKDFYPRKKKNQKSPLTLWRKLKTLENMRNLNIRSHAKYSIITIINWNQYQQNEQPVNNRRTTGEQPTNTNKNDKNDKKYICPFESIVTKFNNTLGDTLPVVRKLTEERKRTLNSRWVEAYEAQNGYRSNTLEFWQELFEYVSKSDFLMGKNGDWRANFDFIITKSKFYKIVEGQYHR